MIDFIANKKPLFAPDEIDFGGDFGKLVTFTSHYTFDRNFSVFFKVRDLTGTCIHKDGEFKFNLDSNGADDKDMMFHPRAWLFELAEMMSYFDFNENSHVKKIAFIGFGMNITLEPSYDDEFERGRSFGRFNILRVENMQNCDINKQGAYMYQLKRLIFREFDYITRNIHVYREFENRNFNISKFNLSIRDNDYWFSIFNENIDEFSNSGYFQKLRIFVATFLLEYCDCPEVISILENNFRVCKTYSFLNRIFGTLYILFRKKLSKNFPNYDISKILGLDDIDTLYEISYYIPAYHNTISIGNGFEISNEHVINKCPNNTCIQSLKQLLSDTDSFENKFVYEIFFKGGHCSKEFNILRLHLESMNKKELFNILYWFKEINTVAEISSDLNNEEKTSIKNKYNLFITLDNYNGELNINYNNYSSKYNKYGIYEFNNFTTEKQLIQKYEDVLEKFDFVYVTKLN